MATVNYSFNLPTVGGSEDAWGTQLNANWTALDTLLGGVTATEFDILDGATVTTAELNILDGVTATTAEINVLDGVTATAAELNILDGVTAKTGLDTALVTGTAGTSGQFAQWNADGDVIGADINTLPQATWEAGTSTTEALVSPAKVKAAIDSFSFGVGGQSWQNVLSSRALNTSYQNTTGQPIQISLFGSTGGNVEVSSDNSTWVKVGQLGQFADHTNTVSIVVPNNYYYRLTGGNIVSLNTWAELR